MNLIKKISNPRAMLSSLALLVLAVVCVVLVGSLASPRHRGATSAAPNLILPVTLPPSVPASTQTLERSLISFSIEGKLISLC
jgi:hypothetical protein